MAKSTKSRSADKPAKPREDFPLFPHQNGQWAKKVKGRLHYFGAWDDADGALNRWLDQRDDLLAGRTPRPKTDGLTLKDLCDRFLTEKLHRLESGELTARSYKDYYAVCQFLCDTLGKHRLASDVAVDDFSTVRREFSRIHGPVRLTKDVGIVRMVFRWGFESGLLETAVRFGPSFRAPSRKNLRKAKRANGRKDFDAAEVRRILDAAPMPLRAMVLLGINCGFGQSDCATLPLSAVDFDNAMVDFPRPKTEVERRCTLWPETVAALRDANASRPKPKDDADADCVFVTKYGRRWVRMGENDDPAKRAAIDAVAQEFAKVMKSLGLNGRRGFYSLRHSFETQAGESRDQVAVDRVMGHSDNSMAGNYRHGISDDRLRDVAAVVRAWLFPDTVKAEAEAKAKAEAESEA